MEPSPKSRPQKSSDLGLLLTLGWGIAAWITIGTVLGRWVDVHGSWAPWGTLTGALCGIAGAGWTVYRVVRRLDRRNSD